MGFWKKVFSIENRRKYKLLRILRIRFKFPSQTLERFSYIEDELGRQRENLECQAEVLNCQREVLNCQRDDLNFQREAFQLEIQNSKQELYDYSFNLVKRTTPMAELRNFEVHLVEHCNLNCQNCNHFVPLAEKSFMSIDVFTKDFTRMAELTGGNVSFINLLGGEPLLHPDLLEFLPIARELFPNTKINIVTNGILLPEQNEEFWQACQKYDITICCTKYPIKIDWEKLEEKAAEYAMQIEYWGPEEEVKLSWFFPIDEEGKQDPTSSFLDCRDANSCIFLQDGKLFTCVTPPNIRNFNKHFNKNIPVSERDYIDIYKAKNIDEILQFLSHPIPFCKYCNVKERKYDLPWKTSSRQIEEWTIIEEEKEEE